MAAASNVQTRNAQSPSESPSEDRARDSSAIVIQNSMFLVARHAAFVGLNALLILFLPRYLGDQGLGQLQFALSFITLLTAGMALGVRQYLIKEVARDHRQIQAFFTTSIGLRIVAAVIVGAIIVGVTSVIDYSQEAKQVIYVIGGMMITLSFAELMAAYLYGLENMRLPVVAEVTNKLVVVAIGLVILLNGHGVAAYASVLFVGAIAQFAINTWYMSRRARIGISFHLPIVKALVIGGAPYLLMGYLLQIYNHIDVVMLRIFTNEAVVGWYAAAIHFHHALQFFPIVLTTALLPTLARMHITNINDVAKIARKGISASILVIVPMALGVSLLSGEIIDMLPYPEGFQNTAPLLTIIALSIPITALLMILGTIVIATDRQKTWAIALGLTVVLDIVLNAALIPYFHETMGNGAIGASLTTLLAETFMVAIGIRLMPSGVIDRATMMILVKSALSGAIMVVIGLGAKAMGIGTPSIVIVCAFTYGALVFLTRAVTREDIKFLTTALARRIKSKRPPTVQQKEGAL